MLIALDEHATPFGLRTFGTLIFIHIGGFYP